MLHITAIIVNHTQSFEYNYCLIFFLGEDHKEDHIEDGMHCVQIQEAAFHQAMQTLRIGWRQEKEGSNDPVLVLLFVI